MLSRLNVPEAGEELGPLLRGWRNRRGQSQLELSLLTGISQRHISFVESGRSMPSRKMLLELADALDVPLRERNTLLLASGYAPIYSESGWDSQQMSAIRSALKRMLQQHDPFPAIVMDRYWNVLLTNASTPQFFGTFFDFASRTGPRNILHLMFDPAGMRPFIVNWEQASAALMQRVQRESVGRTIDQQTQKLLGALQAYPAGPKNEAVSADDNLDESAASSQTPVVSLGFRHSAGILRYFSLVTTVGTPQSVAAQELRVECMFPADAETEDRHRTIMSPFSPGEPH